MKDKIEIRKKLKIEDNSNSLDKTIYVFSNVKYPEKNKIAVQEQDILVFLNKAESARYYRDAQCVKIVYHRSLEDNYGKIVPGCENRYVFDKEKKGNGLPKTFIDKLKTTYDWNYPIEKGKNKCMTTGYMVVKWLERQYGKEHLVLVNFGYEVKHSTYRCPWHNWQYESEALKDFEHIYTEESVPLATPEQSKGGSVKSVSSVKSV